MMDILNDGQAAIDVCIADDGDDVVRRVAGGCSEVNVEVNGSCSGMVHHTNIDEAHGWGSLILWTLAAKVVV